MEHEQQESTPTATSEARLAWVRAHGLADEVADQDAFPDDAITWDEWCLARAEGEKSTLPDQVQARAATIRLWPYRRKDTPHPVPAIDSPEPAAREGNVLRPFTPAIHSRRELDAWARRHAPQEPTVSTEVERMARDREPKRLPDIARAAGMTPRRMREERDLSRERVRAGKARAVEFPDPVSGQHGERGALYRPDQVAAFLRSRPGKGRKAVSRGASE